MVIIAYLTNVVLVAFLLFQSFCSKSNIDIAPDYRENISITFGYYFEENGRELIEKYESK